MNLAPTTIGKVGSRPRVQPSSGGATINTTRKTKAAGSFFTDWPRGSLMVPSQISFTGLSVGDGTVGTDSRWPNEASPSAPRTTPEPDHL